MTDNKIIMDIKDEIKWCYDIKGNISFRKISKELLLRIEEHTTFLNLYNPKIQERIFCILNDIRNAPICGVTGKKLRFSPQTKTYCNSREYANKIKTISNPFNFKEKKSKEMGEIFEIFDNGKYKTLTTLECLESWKKLMVYKNSRITSSMAKIHIDLVCSILNYTKFLPQDTLNLAERIYCIQNGLSSIPVDYYGNKLTFINRFVGYSKFSSKKDMNDYHILQAKDKIDENFIVNAFIKDNNSGTTNRINVTCKSCNYTFEPFFKNALWKNIYCPSCNGLANRSKLEIEMVGFIKSLGIVDIIENDRKLLNGRELDIYLPDHKIAIELCGVLWHSFGSSYPNNVQFEKIKKYNHRKKRDDCEKLGISLITIFDNEWGVKKDIVKSIISNKLGVSKTRVYARKCIYSEIEKGEAIKFLEDNHIQGKCSFSKAYGLYYDKVLISLMCFGKRKITRGDCQHELIRFCNKLDTSVIGGASKILKNSGVCDFISYCDLRYSNGNLYNQLGMVQINTTKPNYFYTLDKIHLLHRVNFQKHKISDSTDPRPEWEIMYDKGYRRIYDCGNLVFEYRNTK